MNQQRRWRRVFVLAALLCVVGPTAAMAQQRGSRRVPPRADRADLERRVRDRFGQMVRMRLGLDDEQAESLGELMKGFEGERMQLGRDEEALRRRVEAALLEGRGSDEEARGLLAQLVELRERELALFRSEQEGLLAVLTPWQLLQFQALREQLNQRVRQLRGARRPGGPGGSTPGGPGALPGGAVMGPGAQPGSAAGVPGASRGR